MKYMRKKIGIIVSLIMSLQMILSAAVIPVHADEGAVPYDVPASQHVTYNMNLDWKFFEAENGMGKSVREAWESAAKNGKQFYDVDYDDSAWETVSIPHGVSYEDAFSGATADAGGGHGRLSVLLYRKTFTVPDVTDAKIFFELEGIRQAAYVWVNGQEVGYYEAGITAMGFDITKYVTPGQKAVIAICNDGSATRGNSYRTMYETVPGEAWGSSYTPNNGSTRVGNGVGFQWNT